MTMTGATLEARRRWGKYGWARHIDEHTFTVGTLTPVTDPHGGDAGFADFEAYGSSGNSWEDAFADADAKDADAEREALQFDAPSDTSERMYALPMPLLRKVALGEMTLSEAEKAVQP